MISFLLDPNPNSTNIVFECSDFRQDMGVIVEEKDDKFELHLHNDYTNQAIAMVLSIEGSAKMFDALEEYFQGAQIEI